ncbi:cysteine hydrolase family protein [uncultured Eudoraea sp.]|uniref:cysteine hydrolase family protein n=1 Tax=uncultured Eudoraea sp. TaxID=1035614 RepID=UPI00260D4EE2|nr:cysteine hydrolase family protein [uncultured Eudoraea sp.]
MNSASKPALLLIDIQKGLDDIDYYGGHRNNLQAESNARKVLDFWRNNKLPIFHVKHNSTNPNSPLVKGKIGNEFKDIVKPLANEAIIEKEVNSAFIGTDLQQKMDKLGIEKVVIVGLTTDHCVSSSARMAGNLGYDTFLVGDATAAFDKVGPNGTKYKAEMIHEIELASIHNEFATVIASDDLLISLKEIL